jgi:hypothetical protein
VSPVSTVVAIVSRIASIEPAVGMILRGSHPMYLAATARNSTYSSEGRRREEENELWNACAVPSGVFGLASVLKSISQ